MKWRVKFVIIIVLSILINFSCDKTKENIILQREWTANAEYVGDIWASKIAGENGIQIQVKEGTELSDPVKVVRTGDANFGVASADRILQENEKGADLVILASATYRTPVVYLTNPNLAINSPSDFKGKTVGIQVGTNTELVLYALMDKVNIARNAIRIVDSGWGIQSFETGDVDVLGAFDYDEPIQLDMKDIQYGKIYPEDYNVHFVGTVYFTRKDFVNENRELIEKFLMTIVKGWSLALSNPNKAIEYLSAYNADINIEKETKSLNAGKVYFQGEDGKLLYSSINRWESMANSLKSMGKIKSFTFSDNVNYQFLETALIKIGKNSDKNAQ